MRALALAAEAPGAKKPHKSLGSDKLLLVDKDPAADKDPTADKDPGEKDKDVESNFGSEPSRQTKKKGGMRGAFPPYGSRPPL
jgi:hypothetical protein